MFKSMEGLPMGKQKSQPNQPAPRAFQHPEPPVDELLLDEAALNRIKEIALTHWHEHKKLSQPQLLFMALHDFLVLRGVKPGFTVKRPGVV
jgi:hypothetical protein